MGHMIVIWYLFCGLVLVTVSNKIGHLQTFGVFVAGLLLDSKE